MTQSSLIVTSCAECGELTPISDDPELKAAGYALCDECEARVAGQAFGLTPKGWDYVMGQIDWQLRILGQTVVYDWAAAADAMDHIAELRETVADMAQRLPAHAPAMVIAACGALYWAVHAVRRDQLTPRESERLALELSGMVGLDAADLINCAIYIARLRGGVNVPAREEIEQAVVTAYIESVVYGVNRQ